jgi:hypothetical protein
VATPSIDPSIKVVKTFTYRGAARQFSNRYHFDNLAPADATKWTTLSDAVVLAEKAIYQSVAGFTISGTVGYDAGSEVPVFSKAYATTATGSFASYSTMPGDVAALVRYSTGQRSLKNHPIYLFNYYHNVGGTSAGAIDLLNPAQRTAMGTYAAAWVTGFSDGSITHHRCGPQGHVATGQLVDQYLRHRDFPAA